jgi:NAD(P)-dependent dehydrogenase (short-subunit alcohol dehydrogenase family)
MRNVIVTGGSRGLGLGIARSLAGVGYRVVAIARRQSDQLPAAIGDAGGGQGLLNFWPFGLAKVGDLANLVKAIRKEFGLMPSGPVLSIPKGPRVWTLPTAVEFLLADTGTVLTVDAGSTA